VLHADPGIDGDVDDCRLMLRLAGENRQGGRYGTIALNEFLQPKIEIMCVNNPSLPFADDFAPRGKFAA